MEIVKFTCLYRLNLIPAMVYTLADLEDQEMLLGEGQWRLNISSGDLKKALVDLYRRAATELPPDIVEALQAGMTNEVAGSVGAGALITIVENARLAREKGKPICQDTGVPVFYIYLPRGVSMKTIHDIVIDATRKATASIPLRPNAVDTLTGKNSGDNVGRSAPIIHFEESDNQEITFELMLKGGGSENISKIYKLPDGALEAGRDLEGVRRCVVDAVYQAQGKGCPPIIAGVAFGGLQDETFRMAKYQLFRKLSDSNPVLELAALEDRLLKEANRLEIGPAGMGGHTGVLGVKIASLHRHPASYFVAVCFVCWACRRATMVYGEDGARYEQ